MGVLGRHANFWTIILFYIDTYINIFSSPSLRRNWQSLKDFQVECSRQWVPDRCWQISHPAKSVLLEGPTVTDSKRVAKIFALLRTKDIAAAKAHASASQNGQRQEYLLVDLDDRMLKEWCDGGKHAAVYISNIQLACDRNYKPDGTLPDPDVLPQTTVTTD